MRCKTQRINNHNQINNVSTCVYTTKNKHMRNQYLCDLCRRLWLEQTPNNGATTAAATAEHQTKPKSTCEKHAS